MPVLMRGIASAAVLLLAIAARTATDEKPWELAAPAPAIRLRPEKLDKLEGETCGRCHGDVLAEWVVSAHAISWLDEAYREALKDKSRPQTCYGCHVPKPLLADGLAARGSRSRSAGATCP